MEKGILFLENDGEKKGIEIIFGSDIYHAEEPVEVEIKETEGGFVTYGAGYDSVREEEGRYYAQAVVRTRYGSRLEVSDVYEWRTDELVLARNVEVIRADGHEAGFATSFGVKAEEGYGLEDYDVFIPGIWYRKNENVVKNAFGSDKTDRCYYMRITRMAMPYVQLYHPDKKSFIVMKHLSPAPETGLKETSAEWLADASFQYSSMGLRTVNGTELRYNFPGSEGEKNYIDNQKAWARRSHPLRSGVKHSYSCSVWGGSAGNSYEAMRRVWRRYYEQDTPKHAEADMAQVYEDSIALLNVYCQEYNGVMGIPFWTAVPQGTVCDISFQMGFVGQQTMCAYHLMKYGYEHGRSGLVEKGVKVIDFWVRESAKAGVLPRVWYDVFPDSFKEDYPTYTRTAADGMEGILASLLLARRYGAERQEWEDFCVSYADWLAGHQNDDGSYYRAYDEKGQPVHRGKYNTSNVIRFLVNMYWMTGTQRYRTAALRAGSFCYDAVYLPMQYVGGTADNDNTIDKEAGMIAVYAFLSLYDMEGKEKWLEAAKGAADYCETWTYVWDYTVKAYKGNGVFDRVSFTGLSLIATGHSHADVMMGYMPFDYYRLYLYTKDEHYRSFAVFLEGNTKQTMDWSRRLGHAYPGLVEESGELAMQYHNGLGKWLPWCTVAEIESLTRSCEWFGTMGISNLKEQGQEAAVAAGKYTWLNGALIR